MARARQPAGGDQGSQGKPDAGARTGLAPVAELGGALARLPPLLNATVTPLTTSFSKLALGVQQTQGAFAGAQAVISDFGGVLGRIPILSAFQPLVGLFSKFASTITAATTPAAGLGKSLATASAGAKQAGAAGMSSAAAFGLVAAAAVAVPAALSMLASQAKQYVGLISPATVTLFDREMKQASATMGVALIPVLQQMIRSTREAGEILLPIMQRLQPVFARLAQIAGENLSKNMEVLATLFGALEPLLTVLVDVYAVGIQVMRPVLDSIGMLATLLAPGIKLLSQELQIILIPLRLLAQMMTDAQRALKVLAEGFANAFNVDIDLAGPLDALKDAAAETRKSFQELMKTMLLLTLAITRSVAPEFGKRLADGMVKSLEKQIERKKTGGLLAPEGVQIQDVQSWGKDLLIAASQAGMGAGAAKAEIDYLKDMAGQITDLNKSTDSLADQFFNRFSDLFLKQMPASLGQIIVNALKGQLPGGNDGDNKPDLNAGSGLGFAREFMEQQRKRGR